VGVSQADHNRLWNRTLLWCGCNSYHIISYFPGFTDVFIWYYRNHQEGLYAVGMPTSIPVILIFLYFILFFFIQVLHYLVSCLRLFYFHSRLRNIRLGLRLGLFISTLTLPSRVFGSSSCRYPIDSPIIVQGKPTTLMSSGKIRNVPWERSSN